MASSQSPARAPRKSSRRPNSARPRRPQSSSASGPASERSRSTTSEARDASRSTTFSIGAPMIIDVHGHLCASPKLYAWFTLLLASRATYGTPPSPMSDDEMLALVETRRNLDAIDGAGTDVQLISPRPFSMFHAERPGRVVHR